MCDRAILYVMLRLESDLIFRCFPKNCYMGD
jgi:hypothetical protein